MTDWTHLQTFIMVAERGSLSAAAHSLNSSQPTLSRHIALLEEALGTRLFDRSKQGMTLTEAGSRLLEQTAPMADAAARIEPASDPQADHVAGSVRLTASQIVATYVLPPILVALRRDMPKIELELVATDSSDNLLRREADIAVRMYRPNQPDVITTLCGHLELGAYASRDYLARRGRPGSDISDLKSHDLIGYDRSTLILDGLRAQGWAARRSDFAFRSDDQVVCWQMVCAGFGIGFNQTVIGDANPDLERIYGPEQVGRLPLWLTAHTEVQRSPRIRRVFDHLRRALHSISSPA